MDRRKRPDPHASTAQETILPSTLLRQRAHDAAGFEQLRELFACVEHAGFDGIAGHAEDVRGLLHRFFVVVDEVDDLAMPRGQPGEAVAPNLSPMLARERRFWLLRRLACGHAPLIHLR